MPASLVYPLSLLLVFLSARVLAQEPPDAPIPQQPSPTTQTPPVAAPLSQAPCQIKRNGAAFLAAAVAGAVAPDPANPPVSPSLAPGPCPPLVPLIDWYARFLSGPQVKPLTPKEKGWLAIRNLIDPFNAVTVAGTSAVYVGINPHSAYGPGIKGFVENGAVTYSEDGISEFFGTFAIPSLVHQDPHYHRMPTASVGRRIVHAMVQVAWTQGDDGRGMINYGNLLGFAIDEQFENLYVPGIQTNGGATAARYFIGLGTAPADNLVTEFMPDVARHFHFRVALIQRIIDQVARTDSGGGL